MGNAGSGVITLFQSEIYTITERTSTEKSQEKVKELVRRMFPQEKRDAALKCIPFVDRGGVEPPTHGFSGRATAKFMRK